ncbi:PRELI domain-containing protein 1, mitochondrial [Holothuria leucospilota]|uniref:PRELI domain-containing protein 1, mitochondrial n=1 Tax=Holothuria leucospilota TaxID=206669 RepID=A0A9Q0YNG6_HOLLE|nr:PRELI domain-containing protein 1, mitochondrial [Holothuria leucospilota]
MKYYSCFAVFKHQWDQVASAVWQKYPNPYSKHVLSEDIVHRSLLPDGRRLYSRRLLTKTNRMPRWGNIVFGANAHLVSVLEESVVDPMKKTFTTYTRNLGYTSFMVVEEKCVYQQSSENSGWTELQRQVWVDSSVLGFARAIQKFGVERYKSNCNKSFKGLQYIINKMFVPEQAETHIPQKVDQLTKKAKAAQDLARQGKRGPVVQ